MALTLLSSRAAAETEEPVVAIVSGAADASTASRIESELKDMGITSQTLILGGDAAAGEPLSAIGERLRVAAAIRIGADRSIEVWAAGEPEVEAVAANGPSDGGDRLIAIAAAELVRARLLDAGPDPAPAGKPPAARSTATATRTPAVLEARAEPAPRRSRVAAEVGPAVLASGLDLAPTFNAFLAIAVFVVKPLSVELFGATPLVPARAENGAGSMRMHTALAGGGLRLGFESGSGRFSGFAAPGFAALILALDGDAAEGYEARSEAVATAAPILRLAGSIRLASRLRLVLEALAGLALSEIAVRLGGRDAARVGRPILGGALCLEVVIW